MQNINQKLPINVIITTFLLALFADTKFINLIVLAARPSLAGTFMTLMYAVVVVGLFFMGMVSQKHSLGTLSASHKGICLLCIVWYFMTSSFIGNPSVSWEFFGIFTVAAFLIPGIIQIDVRLFLLALMMLSSVGIFYSDQIIINSIMEAGVLSMGICYSMLVPVLANLVYLRYYFMREKKLMKVLVLPFTVINIFYLVQMTMFGSRGPVLCAILLIASFFLLKITDDSKIALRKGRVAVATVSVVVVALFFVPILQYISYTLDDYGISLNFVDKFLRMDGEGDITNGRDHIDKIVWDGIAQSPLLGHGTAQFEMNTGIVYPHNFLFQMLYDGGFVLIALIMIPIFRTAIRKIRTAQLDEMICLTFLLFASVPAALFSGDLWQSLVLWLFFGFILSKKPLVEKLSNKKRL